MNRSEYERRRIDIARREYNLRVQRGQLNQYSQPFDVWFTGSFLTDALLVGLVINELGEESQVVEEQQYEEPAPVEESSSYEESYDSSSNDSYDDGGSYE